MNIAEQCRAKVDAYNDTDNLIPAIVKTIEDTCLRLADKGMVETTFSNKSFCQDGSDNPLRSRKEGEELDWRAWHDISNRIAALLREDGFTVATRGHGYVEGVMLVSW